MRALHPVARCREQRPAVQRHLSETRLSQHPTATSLQSASSFPQPPEADQTGPTTRLLAAPSTQSPANRIESRPETSAGNCTWRLDRVQHIFKPPYSEAFSADQPKAGPTHESIAGSHCLMPRSARRVFVQNNLARKSTRRFHRTHAAEHPKPDARRSSTRSLGVLVA